MIMFEKFNIKEIREICMKDSYISSQPKEFVERNCLTLYTLANTWYLLISEYAPISAEIFSTLVKDKGMIFVIKTLSLESEKFIKEEGNFLPFSLQLMNELLFDGNWQQRFLMLLRFGKRYSPVSADILVQDTVQDFIQTENRTKLMQRRPTPMWLLDVMKSEITTVLGNDPKVNPDDRYFSNGACSEGSTLGEKLGAIAHNFRAPWGFEYPLVWDGEMDDISYTCHVLAVPKSYKAARIIAMEETYRQYENTAVYMAILHKMQSSPYYNQFCIEDQERNRSICCTASINADFATIDLSHASDCNSKALVRSIFPSNWVKLLFENISTKAILPSGKTITLQMFSAAGSVLTFCVETLTFWSIARVAKSLYESLTNDIIGDVSVYGDDIIVPTQIAELTMDLLERLGFIVNHDKTFCSPTGHYRETCGAEYLNGYDVSMEYWPRTAMEFDSKKGWFARGLNSYKSLTTLVDFQRRIFQHTRAGMFLASVVREIIPDFTSSNPNDSSATDLYEIFPICKEGYPPHEKGTLVPDEAKRELHYCSMPSYGKFPYDRSWNYDIYRYQKFLRNGPRYEDPFLELLGVSSPDAPLNEVYTKPDIKWRLVQK